jgi:hypothetical protein
VSCFTTALLEPTSRCLLRHVSYLTSLFPRGLFSRRSGAQVSCPAALTTTSRSLPLSSAHQVCTQPSPLLVPDDEDTIPLLVRIGEGRIAVSKSSSVQGFTRHGTERLSAICVLWASLRLTGCCFLVLCVSLAALPFLPLCVPFLPLCASRYPSLDASMFLN